MRSSFIAALALILSVASPPCCAEAAYTEAEIADPGTWRPIALRLALEAARSVDDAYRRAEALAAVARASADAGVDAQSAHRVIEEALAAALEIREIAFRDWVLHDVALARIAVGDLHGAREAAGLMRTDRPHGALLSALAELEMRRGDLEAAQAIADEIRHAPDRAEALRQLVASHAARQNLDAARALLRSIRDPWLQTAARGDLAVALIRAGDAAAAHAVAARAPRKHRADAFGRIAMAQLAAGDAAGALESLRSMDDVEQRAALQGRVALARFETGAIVDARKLLATAFDDVERTPRSSSRTRSLVQLARIEAAMGDSAGALRRLERARADARTLVDVEERDEALELIARGQARLGGFGVALASALEVRDEMARALLVRDIAAASLRNADAAAAENVELDDPLLATAVGFGVLGAQLSRGDRQAERTIETARRAVRRIEPQLRPAAFAALAAAYVRLGSTDAGVATFREALDSAAALARAELRAAAYVRSFAALDDRLMFLGQPPSAGEPADRR